MLRAQLAERKKAILQRINKEGKEKLEQVLNWLTFTTLSFQENRL